MKLKIHEEGALLGGEVSGHIFIGENYYGFDDAPLVSLKTLEIFSKRDKTVGDVLDEIPKLLTTPEIIMSTPDEVKFDVIAGMQKKLQERKILGESRDSRVKLQMNAAQELELLLVDDTIMDEETLRIVNNGIKEAFKDYQKKLQKEMVKDVDLDQIKKFLS